MNQNAEQQRYLDVEECAVYIRSTPASVRQMVHLRRLPYVKHGRRVLFDRQAIDNHLATCLVEALRQR
jgi:excisionase family DNA binding protein